eukprot:s2051_g10.t1
MPETVVQLGKLSQNTQRLRTMCSTYCIPSAQLQKIRHVCLGLRISVGGGILLTHIKARPSATSCCLLAPIALRHNSGRTACC